MKDWDVTVIDMLATSQSPGAAAETAADRKTSKYAILSQPYLFVPVAVETMGAINVAGMNFLGDLGRRITKYTYDHRESAFLFQRISTLIQRFNAVAVLGTFAPTTRAAVRGGQGMSVYRGPAGQGARGDIKQRIFLESSRRLKESRN